MFSGHLGELSALGTAILWSFTYVQFTAAVRSIGPKKLNRLRLLVALVLLLVAHWVAFGTPLPRHAELSRWGWLTLSGVIGFAMSDAMLFRAMFHLGAHRTSLVMALIPLSSALLAWGAFGESMAWAQIVAALITLAGVTIVVSARQRSDTGASQRTGVGVLFALGAVMAQSLRYILSKQGMSGAFPPLSANTMQILAATVAIWIPAVVRRDVLASFVVPEGSRARQLTVGGAVTGPFLGVTLSMVALSKAPVGIASTLMALTPLFLLPFAHFVFKERMTVRAVLGTCLAVGGAACLFLV